VLGLRVSAVGFRSRSDQGCLQSTLSDFDDRCGLGWRYQACQAEMGALLGCAGRRRLAGNSLYVFQIEHSVSKPREVVPAPGIRSSVVREEDDPIGICTGIRQVIKAKETMWDVLWTDGSERRQGGTMITQSRLCVKHEVLSCGQPAHTQPADGIVRLCRRADING
jgi:hypothetical protein